MELARPAVDDRVLSFLQATTFHAGDFTQVSDGSCRLHPQLARRSWRQVVYRNHAWRSMRRGLRRS